MLTEIKVPGFPESVTDGVVATWHKRPGDEVRRDETVVEIETDKVMFEVPAPEDGILSEVLQQEGATVTAGQLLGRIETDARGEARKAEAGAARGSDAAAQAPPAGRAAGDAGGRGEPPASSPAARQLMSEHGLSAGSVEGSGRGGRILKEDVLRAIGDEAPPEAIAARRAAPAAGAPGAAPAKAEAPERAAPPAGQPARAESPPPPASSGERPQRRVQMTRLRARIAERLVQAQQTAAILTTFNEVDMQPVMELRKRYREAFEKAHGVRLGFMSFFVLAAAEALKRFPVVNASIEGDDIVYHGFCDIGIAVASPRGLVVPVLRDADRLGVAEIERRIADYAAKAQDGTLTIEEITGGTFTITNGGVFGSLLSTPILNPPQSAILGMHRIEQRPVVVDGQIVARPMMYLALSYDHRLIDGREAVLFLSAIRDLLQDPARLLLEV